MTVAVQAVAALCVDQTVAEEVAVADMAVAIVVIVMAVMIVVEAVVPAVKIVDHPFSLEIFHGHPLKKNLLIYSVNMEKSPTSDSLWTVKQIAHVEWVSVNLTQKNHVNP